MSAPIRPEDLLVRLPYNHVGAFEVIHEPCGQVVLLTQHVHVDTLLRLSHVCDTRQPVWARDDAEAWAG